AAGLVGDVERVGEADRGGKGGRPVAERVGYQQAGGAGAGVVEDQLARAGRRDGVVVVVVDLEVADGDGNAVRDGDRAVGRDDADEQGGVADGVGEPGPGRPGHERPIVR